MSTRNLTSGANDFTTTSGTVRSSPNAVVSTNATVSQALVSPLFNFEGRLPDRISFYTRRSSTHGARVVVEASLDSGNTFPVQLGDTLRNIGSTGYVNSTFVLPSELSGGGAVQFRWRVIPDSSGSSGTFRIDDITITVKASRDLALAALRIIPSLPAAGDPAFVSARVVNAGAQPAPIFQVSLYLDANSDSIPQAGELVTSVSSTAQLAPLDSIDLTASLGPLPAGGQFLIAEVRDSMDENPLNNRMRALITVGYPRQSVVINEIMYAPTGTEPEWVEIYNTSSLSVNLRNWSISDNVVTAKHTVTPRDLMLLPLGYAVLTKDSASLLDVHQTVPWIVIDVSGFPTLNNSGDAVVLFDNRSITIDSVGYVSAWGGSSGGKSLERIDPVASSTSQSNWRTSHNTSGSTPATRNSVTRKPYDLQIDTLLLSPAFPSVGDSVVVHVKVHNPGTEEAESFRVLFFDDRNTDSIAQQAELLSSVQSSGALPPLDSIVYPLTVQGLGAGSHHFIVVLDFSGDEDMTNNTQGAYTFIGIPAGSVRINEIMYAPPTGVPEWIELVNISADTINMKNWQAGNRSLSHHTISSADVLIKPSEFLVVTKDSALLRQAYPGMPDVVMQSVSLPTFLWSNNGDAVALADSRGKTIDSVFYGSTWGGAGGTSLEKIDAVASANDSMNWVSSQDSLRATPGRQNSVAPLDFDLRLIKRSAVSIQPQSNALFSLTVWNVGKQPCGPFQFLLYDDRNRDSSAASDELFQEIQVSQSLAPRESLVVPIQWSNVSPGVHNVVAVVDFPQDQRLLNNRTIFPVRVGFAPRALVINEIMFAPLTGNAEYVELMNMSNSDVDLSGWSISDRPGSDGRTNTFGLAVTSRLLHAGELFVLASDSSILSLFPHLRTIEPRLMTIANQGSLGLNNDGDDVVLCDIIGLPIDSVAYGPAWHNPSVTDYTGRSLEKIQPFLGSNDARAWSTCVNVVGGTPGMPNSILVATLPSQSKLSFSPNPFSPDGDGVEDFVVVHYEVPMTISLVNIKIFDVRGRLIRRLANSEPSASRGNLVWDGLDDEKRRARVGIYIVFLEAIDDRGGVLETAKGVVVLAARL